MTPRPPIPGAVSGSTQTVVKARRKTTRTAAEKTFAAAMTARKLSLVHFAVLLRLLRFEATGERRRIFGTEEIALRRAGLVTLVGTGKTTHTVLTDEGRKLALELRALAKLSANTEREIVRAVS